ncbi:KpsF/GutQ family sugar-phosphate isomerase [Sphingobacteriales bacterium UPWRP_1]|nr:D-arabinose 5-phosphate isomerase [Sphingobacteriales bacterium TSM_CSS]PSJ76721.1 KpsF/GutQ family sugar-phosphate isomerase [Sphingobacteriales bacterium UPWRP_1]
MHLTASSFSVDQILATAAGTLRTEAEALNQLPQLLTPDFAQCALDILHSPGRVVVTGIGKSAIIAQKITATLNSTGTQAMFMHAADAIHGDLGMVTQPDMVICISKSGETPEIKVLVPMLKKLGSKLTAITGNVHSYLAKQAHYVLNATVLHEACPNNLAPTSSTTAQMALGDALAVCLLELRGFTALDFARVHPGGALGKQLYLSVDDIYLQHNAPRVPPNATLSETIVEMTSNLLGATAVTDSNGHLLGIITDGDLRRLLQRTDGFLHLLAKDIMTPNPKTIQKGTLAIHALEKMKQHKITQLVVTSEDNRYMGIVHIHDLVREGLV